MGCELCPRRCNAAREAGEVGYCKMPAEPLVARAALHPFEEPCISGTRGSGTVFFTGCSLGCVFCQNQDIRGTERGRVFSPEALGELFLTLQEKGAHNINLVTPTHYADRIAEALTLVKARLAVPVVYNCGGYERVETLRMLDGLVEVYLPDFKYVSSELSGAYSAAPDYAEHATAALCEMVRQTGPVRFDGEGLMIRGVMVRHLVLPGSRADSIAVLDRIASTVGTADIRLALMRQYTPDFAPRSGPKALLRRVTSFEYDSVMAHAVSLGFDGYFQAKDSASAAYTPNFARMEIVK